MDRTERFPVLYHNLRYIIIFGHKMQNKIVNLRTVNMVLNDTKKLENASPPKLLFFQIAIISLAAIYGQLKKIVVV